LHFSVILTATHPKTSTLRDKIFKSGNFLMVTT
jgi:hypothetical protein